MKYIIVVERQQQLRLTCEAYMCFYLYKIYDKPEKAGKGFFQDHVFSIGKHRCVNVCLRQNNATTVCQKQS